MRPPSLLPTLLLTLPTCTAQPPQQHCRCIPPDPCWPTPATWNQLNTTVSGRLIATTPLAAPCHDPIYNATQCQALRDTWHEPATHYDSSSSIMAPFFANRSCDPFAARETPCALGNYVAYAINASSAADIAAGIAFARDSNIRLVVRNTGHDYNGKSTAPAALALWTHHLTSTALLPGNPPAIHLGAGVQASSAYAFAAARGLAVVGGECPSVGIVGGYAQGGGHSSLSSAYGLAADQVVAWEVVDGTGALLTVDRHRNADLFWALRGGGGGTYGVVVAATVRAWPDVPVAGARVGFESGDAEVLGKAVRAWHAVLPALVEAGATAVYTLTNTSFTAQPITAPGLSADELGKLLEPFLARLDELGIEGREVHVESFPGFLPQFEAMQGAIQVGVLQYGSWLLPRTAVLGGGLEEAYRRITADGATVIGVALDVGSKGTGGRPWDDNAPWEEGLEWQRRITEVYVPLLKALAPESGAYLNEADFRQPDWKGAFYGANYERLRAVKARYDPDDVFYALTAVGSDEWEVDGDGRLCRVGQAG